MVLLRRAPESSSLKDTASLSPEASNAICKSLIKVFQECNSNGYGFRPQKAQSAPKGTAHGA